MHKKGFTLAELHNTFTTTIRELVSSDRYYSNGDLGIKADKTLIDGTHTGDNEYLCKTLGDMVNAKSSDCTFAGKTNEDDYITTTIEGSAECSNSAAEASRYETIKNDIDEACATNCQNVAYVELADGSYFYETAPRSCFGIGFGQQLTNENGSDCASLHGAACTHPARHYSAATDATTHPDCNGFDRVYKTLCVDIDELCKGEAPFGYGVRVDGKILNGARADEWLTKPIQEK